MRYAAAATLGLIAPAPHLDRSLTLRGAVALNLLDMIGVGPFITLPLLLGAMGGPQALLGWILGALLALCDGLVWAELGAALPAAGGSFHFLRRIYPGRLGRYLSFLFLIQLLISAPLSVASGAIGLSHYAGFLLPLFARSGTEHTAHLGPLAASVSAGPATAVAVAAILLAVLLLYRRLARIEMLSILLATVVLGTIAAVILTALLTPAAHLARAFTFPPNAFLPNHAFFSGLASAMLIATYDYWGYYNVTFLGAEVRDPANTIPRAILGSILLCAALYLALTLSVLSVLPWQDLLSATNPDARRAVISLFTVTAWTPLVGPHLALLLGRLAAVLVMLAAFASIFSLLLGYSRIPFAAAREGAFFSPFARLDREHNLPYLSLFTLGAIAILCCFLSLGQVIAALVVVRILLQFLLQHLGVLYLRHAEPTLPRPFRLWLYPLPPLAAIAGFTYLLLARPNFTRELGFAALLILFGSVTFRLTDLARGIHGPPGNV